MDLFNQKPNETMFPFKSALSKTGLNSWATDYGAISGVKQLATPYGFYSMPVTGIQVYCVPIGDKDIIVGTPMNNTTVKAGEVYIKGSSSAYIHLKQNGTIVLNGLTINANGTIV